MKRFLAMLLCLVTVFTLAGCSLSKTEYYSDYTDGDTTQNSSKGNSAKDNKDNSSGGSTGGDIKTDIKGAVGGQTDANAAAWGIKTDKKGIEKKVNLKGKTVKMAVFNTAR